MKKLLLFFIIISLYSSVSIAETCSGTSISTSCTTLCENININDLFSVDNNNVPQCSAAGSPSQPNKCDNCTSECDPSKNAKSDESDTTCVCKSDYYMVNGTNYTDDPSTATACYACTGIQTSGLSNCTCSGGTAAPICNYNINYNVNGGSGTMTSTICKHAKDCSISTNSFTKTGYNFSRWNTKDDGSGTSPSSPIKQTFPDSTVTLYAIWAPNTITISYSPGSGAEKSNANNTTCKYDADCTAPNPTNNYYKTGYTFAGWECKKQGGTDSCDEITNVNDINSSGEVSAGKSIKNANKGSSDGQTNGITLTAQWIPCAAGNYIDKTATDPSKQCKICEKGWYCEGDGYRRVCPRAMTTVCNTNNKNNEKFFNDTCTTTPTTDMGAKTKKACALVKGSKICDSRDVCYEFPDKTLIYWKADRPKP
jgi:uncharacterized repeat protein (TIGR02543 family)